MTRYENIIGRGFLGNNFIKIHNVLKKKNYIIYAAGISNSKIKSRNDLKREVNYFKSFSIENSSKKIIYISTADINNNLTKKSKYVKNKIKIEKIIKKIFKHYVIVRLPQIIGKSKNRNTLINFFYFKIKNNKRFIVLKNYKRNILDIDDVLKVLKILINDHKVKNKIITLSNKYSVNPIEIVKIFEKKLKKKAKYLVRNSPAQIWPLNFSKNVKYFTKANIRFNRNYLLKKINKYY